jgi:hypothetical protein
MSKKKDQEKFNEYSINTDDAWEIDDGKMTPKNLDNDEDDDLGISKHINDLKTKISTKVTSDTSVGNKKKKLIVLIKNSFIL